MGFETRTLTREPSFLPLSHITASFNILTYHISYISVKIVYHSYAIIFTAVSIKNIVNMSSNKNSL